MTLERAILEVLRDCGGNLLPEKAVGSEVGLQGQTGTWPTPTETADALRSLEEKKQVVSVRNTDRGMRWKITDEGRARLAE